MLSELDIDAYYQEQFKERELCHMCGKEKLCISDMGNNLSYPCFICLECDTKRHNDENEYERLHQG